MGRAALEEKDKIYMMKRDVEYMDNPAAIGKSLLFNFML